MNGNRDVKDNFMSNHNFVTPTKVVPGSEIYRLSNRLEGKVIQGLRY